MLAENYTVDVLVVIYVIEYWPAVLATLGVLCWIGQHLIRRRPLTIRSLLACTLVIAIGIVLCRLSTSS